MGFVKTFEQIMANIRATADFYDAQMLSVFWETKPEIIASLLPPPLKPASLMTRPLWIYSLRFPGLRTGQVR
jgi:acetoacetate decarboxylase